MARDPHNVDAAAYNSVVARALLRNVRLTESRFDLKPEALSVDPQIWQKDIRGEVDEIFLDEERGQVVGIFTFEVVCRYRRKRLVNARAKYLVSYQVSGPFDAKSAELFVERVGRVVAYPYFRAVIASLASQAGVQMPPLPIISLAPRTVSSGADLQEHGPVKVLTEEVRLRSKRKSPKKPNK